MPRLLALAVAVHGVVTLVIGAGAVTRPDADALATPPWMSWWPGPFGRSWLVDALHLGTTGSVVSGLLWCAAGVGLVAAGLALAGVPALAAIPSWLLPVAAGIGLLALATTFHPFYLLAVAINVALVLAAPHAVAMDAA